MRTTFLEQTAPVCRTNRGGGQVHRTSTLDLAQVDPGHHWLGTTGQADESRPNQRLAVGIMSSHVHQRSLWLALKLVVTVDCFGLRQLLAWKGSVTCGRDWRGQQPTLFPMLSQRARDKKGPCFSVPSPLLEYSWYTVLPAFVLLRTTPTWGPAVRSMCTSNQATSPKPSGPTSWADIATPSAPRPSPRSPFLACKPHRQLLY